MSYLDVSKIEVCKTLEDNYDIILEEYKSFQFDINKVVDVEGKDDNWEMWKKIQKLTYKVSSKSKEGLTDEVYEKGFADYVASFKPYQAAHGWYGLKSESDKSVWDGVLLETRANLDNTMSSKLNSTPVCDDFFNRTINCLQGFPKVMNVMLARLPAGGELPKHSGFPSLNRIHFGMIVPEGDISFCVGGELKKWEEGKCLAFNDGSEHTAWNNTDTDRVVMIVHVIK